MKKIAVVLVLFGFYIIAKAQKDSVQYGTQMLLEYNILDLTEFNAFLYNNSLPATDYHSYSIQFGVTANYHKIQCSLNAGGILSTVFGNSFPSAGYSSSFLAGDFGYDLIGSKNLHLYPLLGYKIAQIRYTYEVQNGYTLADYLKRADYNKKLYYLRHNLDVGIGAEFGKIMVFGLKAGFYIPLGKGSWRFDNTVIRNNTPTISFLYFIDFYCGLKAVSTSE